MKTLLTLFLLVSITVYADDLVVPGQNEAQAWYEEIVDTSPETAEGLTAEERQKLWTTVSRHKVAALSQLSKYDNQKIGFCFGRAMAVHLVARKMGLKKDSLAKLFIIGDLRSGPDPEWRFHVTTIVRGAEDGALYAIDPIMRPPTAGGTPLPMGTWIETVRNKWDKNRKAHLYLVNPESILPEMTVVPTKPELDLGNRIVELSFEPQGKEGFVEQTVGTNLVYTMNEGLVGDHFIGTREPVNEQKFNFLFFDMTIVRPTETIVAHLKFNNYFIDLLEDLKKPLDQIGEVSDLPVDNAAAASFGHGGANLHSISIQ